MTSPLATLEPRSVWQHFDQLRQIPRPSQHEEQVLAHLKQWAAGKGFAVQQDKVGNLCIRVPATPGHEQARTVILQGHVDIVAEKDKATQFDFLKDPIEVAVKGEWVVAEHTTLGADNGIGVAFALASAVDPAVVHGPLELLFTVDEETALTGATSLDGSMLKGRTMINIDSEEDGTLFVGCAGGATTEITFPVTRTDPTGGRCVQIEVGGLKGGHSGLAIHENRGNALKIMARLIDRFLAKEPACRVKSIEGGNKHNAIPREAQATVCMPEAFLPEAKALAEALVKQTLTEIRTIDPGLTIKLEAGGMGCRPLDADGSRRLVRLLLGLPHGVLAMSRDIAGLTETSTNLAIVRTEDDKVEIITSTRSSVEAALRFGLDQSNAVIALAGATHREVGGYPGWQPDLASPLLKACKEVFRGLRGKDPHVTAIHAGLECGLIGEKLSGGADMISFGPQLEGVHAPGERMNIPSVARTWEFHKALLKSLA